jgi:hypothetical protein
VRGGVALSKEHLSASPDLMMGVEAIPKPGAGIAREQIRRTLPYSEVEFPGQTILFFVDPTHPKSISYVCVHFSLDKHLAIIYDYILAR